MMNTEEIKLRTTAEEKTEIQSNAQRAGMSVSAFIRTCCLSDQKVIFLEEGKTIAGKLCEIYNHLDYCVKHQHLDDDSAVQLSHNLEGVSTLLTQLTEQLTMICSDEEEDEMICPS